MSSDVPSVEAMTKGLHRAALTADIARFLKSGMDDDGTRITAHVVEAANQIVGVSVTRSAREEAVRYRAHYNLEEFILFSHYSPLEHACISHFLISPLFERFAKYALREVMRKSRVSSVYHCISHPETALGADAAAALSSLNSHMIPVRRRKQIVFPLPALGANAPRYP